MKTRQLVAGAMFIAFAASVGGCAFLLDTDSLKSGSGQQPEQDGGADTSVGGSAGSAGQGGNAGSAGQGGNAGSAGQGGSSPDAGTPCNANNALGTCDDDDPCTVDRCIIADGKTAGLCDHKSHDGPVLSYAYQGTSHVTPIISDSKKMGPPTLVNDGNNFYLATWYSKSGTADETIQIWKYDASPQISPKTKTIAAAGDYTFTPYSSPAMLVMPKTAQNSVDRLMMAYVGADTQITALRGILLDTAALAQTLAPEVLNKWILPTTGVADTSCIYKDNNANYAESIRPHMTRSFKDEQTVVLSYRCNDGLGIFAKPMYGDISAGPATMGNPPVQVNAVTDPTPIRHTWTNEQVVNTVPVIAESSGSEHAFGAVAWTTDSNDTYGLKLWHHSMAGAKGTSALIPSATRALGLSSAYIGFGRTVVVAAYQQAAQIQGYSAAVNCDAKLGCTAATPDKSTGQDPVVHPGVGATRVANSLTAMEIGSGGFFVLPSANQEHTFVPVIYFLGGEWKVVKGKPQLIPTAYPVNPYIFVLDKAAATGTLDDPPLRNMAVSVTPDGNTMAVWRQKTATGWTLQSTRLLATPNAQACK